MENKQDNIILELIASTLEYPQEDFPEKINELSNRVENLNTKDSSVSLLKKFAEFVNTHKIEELQELYVKTFEVNPVCSLYASIHLFGEESFKRSDFMARLKQAYNEYGMTFNEKELPDFIPIILRFIAYLKDEKRLGDFIKRCILNPLDVISNTMIETLENKSNPYKSLMEYIKKFAENNLTDLRRINYA